MSGFLIKLDKFPGVRLVGVGETWHHLFEKYVLKVMGYESTHSCRDDQIYAGLKAGIDGAVHGVHYILKTNSTLKK